MSDPDALTVWHERHLVGVLRRNPAGAVGFDYDPDWIKGGGFAVSCCLPLAARRFAPEEGSAQRWFANLLPEGSVRERIVRDTQAPKHGFRPAARRRRRVRRRMTNSAAVGEMGLLERLFGRLYIADALG